MHNIIHIRDYYPSKENPAASPWVFDQVSSLKDLGVKSIVISPTPYLPGFLRSRKKYYLYPKHDETFKDYLGTKVVRPVFLKVPKEIFVSLNLKSISRCILRLLPKLDPVSLIHAHFGQNGVASLKLKKKLNVPLITSFYGYDAGRLASLYKPYYKELIENGDLFLALSEDMKIDLLNLGFPEDKIVLHHLGIDLKQFTPSENSVESPFVYLVVARLDESKGVQDVITAYSKCKQVNTQLRIVGDGGYKSKLEELVTKLKLQNNVFFINNFQATNPRQVVVDEMQNCDVVLLTSFITSNGAKEGTPVVLMEAQACGKPCIATKHAGIPEVVIDNKTGYILAERDIENITNRMELFYNNASIRKQMGKNALIHIHKEFNQEIQMQKLYELYNNLIQ